jgi:hypothetical protein
MRRAEQPPTPEATAALATIDAALAGEPVDPGHAEIAELALLIAAERPAPAEEFAAQLDRRVADRFAPPTPSRAPTQSKRRRWKTSWALAPAVSLALAGLVVLLVLTPGNGGSSSGSSSASSAAPKLSKVHGAFGPRAESLGQAAKRKAQLKSYAVPNSPATAAPGLQVPGGRKLIQSSQLTLGARPRRIETVAQEVLNAIGAQNGFVDSATVNATGSSGGYARIQLTVPSANLPQAMTSLSKLPYASVLARTDKVEDVTGQLQSAKRHHQKARVRALEHGVAYSKISLNIQADAPPVATHHRRHHDTGFTISRAAHDALDVLTVIGGIALIALAVLVPLALVAYIAWQLREALRRRQRDRALDPA